MRLITALSWTLILLILFSPPSLSSGQNAEEKITLDSVLAELKTGNKHHVAERTRGMPGDPVSNAVRMNVELVVKQLRSSTPILSELVAHGKLRIVGAVYSIETGAVTWLPEVS